MLRRSFLPLPLAAFGQTALPPYAEWDRETADKLLTESPWAQSVDAPLKDRAYRSELYLTVRWASALPMRQANAVALGRDSHAAKLMLAAAPKEYIIEVAGFPAGALGPAGPKGLERELAASAALAGKKGPSLAANFTSVPEFGSHMMAEIRFPRQHAFTLEDEWVEFRALVLKGRVNIRARFVLKAMLYGAKLEL